MRNHTVRLYAASVALLVFFVLWAAIASHPWRSASAAVADKRLLALEARQHRLQREAVAVRKLVALRWSRYGRELSARRREIALVRARYSREIAAARAEQRVVYIHAGAATQSTQQPAGAVSSTQLPSAAPAPRAAAPAASPAPPPAPVAPVSAAPVTRTASSH